MVEDLYLLARWQNRNFFATDRVATLVSQVWRDQVSNLYKSVTVGSDAAYRLIDSETQKSKDLYDEAARNYKQLAESPTVPRSSSSEGTVIDQTRPVAAPVPVVGGATEGPVAKPAASGKSRITLDDVAGLNDVKAEVHRLVTLPYTNPELARAYDIKPGRGILMYGPPGNGKTLLAKAIAGSMSAKFINLSGSDIISRWRGGSEEALRDIFSQARAAATKGERVVLFVDEVDSIAPQRDNAGSSEVANANRTMVNELLTQLDGVGKDNSGILVLAATNAPWLLDTAFLRPGRIDQLLMVPLPDQQAVRSMLERSLKTLPVAPELVTRLDAIAKTLTDQGYSGAEITEIVKVAKSTAMTQAVNEGCIVPIDSTVFDNAAARTQARTDPATLQKLKEWGVRRIP